MATLGEKLRVLRKKRGWSQAIAAEHLGVSSQVVSNYERDYRTPDKDALVQIANVFNCTVDWLLNENDIPEILEIAVSSPKKEETIDGFLDDLELSDDDLLRKYNLNLDGRRLTSDEVKKVLTIFRTLRD